MPPIPYSKPRFHFGVPKSFLRPSSSACLPGSPTGDRNRKKSSTEAETRAQDRSRWDRTLIERGLAALELAERLAAPPKGLGPYALQAAIAACHARAARAEDTDWPRIVALYDALLQLQPGPVVALNRAVAVSMAVGPARALPLVDALRAEPALRDYPWLHAVRGDLLARLGRDEEARAEFRHAAALTRNRREQALLLARAGDPA